MSSLPSSITEDTQLTAHANPQSYEDQGKPPLMCYPLTPRLFIKKSFWIYSSGTGILITSASGAKCQGWRRIKQKQQINLIRKKYVCVPVGRGLARCCYVICAHQKLHFDFCCKNCGLHGKPKGLFSDGWQSVAPSLYPSPLSLFLSLLHIFGFRRLFEKVNWRGVLVRTLSLKKITFIS